MILLKSIRIRNFRAIKELTFKPKVDGITGIFGENGAGKTSILTAVIFALYGEMPKGVTKQGLRKIGSGDDECSVSVVFQHRGQDIEVIREMKGDKNTIIANVWVDGVKEAVSTPSAVNTWMHKRLGMDAEGFLTVFAVRQKELDAFVQAVPSERKRIIEKLAGVDTVNQALKKSREVEKDSRKALDALPGTEEGVLSAQHDTEYLEEETEKAKQAVDFARANIAELEHKRESFAETINTLAEKSQRYETIMHERESLQKHINLMKDTIERVSYIKNITTKPDVEKLRAEYATLREQAGQKNSELTLEKEKLRQNVEQANTLNAEILRVQQILANAPDLPTEDEVLQKKDELNARFNLNVTALTKLSVERDDLQESIAALEGSADCPTCKTHLEDPEKLVNSFNVVLAQSGERARAIEEENSELSDELSRVEETLMNIHTKQNLEAELNSHKEALAELEQSRKEEKFFSSLEAEVASLEAQQLTVRETGTKAASYEQDRALFESTQSELDDAVMQNYNLETELAELKFSDQQVQEANNLKAQFQQVEKDLREQNQHLAIISGDAAALNERVIHARNNLTRLSAQWESKKGLQAAYTAKTLTTDMLERFRQELVSSMAPEISDYATENIFQMTNGDFTEIRLDDEFRAYTTDANGIERPSSWLSGGEESAVALSLRLAVSSLISGGTAELLWLDEPLTAQDKNRRTAILSMIRRLPITQIMMINHADDAQDIVDYSVTLVKDGSDTVFSDEEETDSVSLEEDGTGS